MPIRKRFKEKEVNLTSENTKILQTYQEALNEVLKGNQCKEEGDEVAIPLVPGKEERRTGGWWFGAISSIHSVLRIKSDRKKKRILPKFEVDFDVPAHELYKVYRNLHNDMVAKHHDKPWYRRVYGSSVEEQAESNGLSGYLLVREIFLRIAAVALCDDIGPSADGEILYDVAKSFLGRIIREDVLSEEKIPTELESELVGSVHKSILEDILSMVKVLKVLHDNKSAIAQALNTLESAKYELKVRAVMWLSPGMMAAQVSESWIDRTLMLAEEDMLTLTAGANSSAVATTLERQANLISAYKRRGPPSEALESLQAIYQHLYEAEQLTVLLGQIDMLRTIGGWLPVIYGGCDMAPVADKIKTFGQELEALREVVNKDCKFVKEIHGINLSYQGMPGHSSWTSAASHLISLHDPDKHAVIAKIARNSIAGILAYQEDNGISVVDVGRLNAVFPPISSNSQRQTAVEATAGGIVVMPPAAPSPLVALPPSSTGAMMGALDVAQEDPIALAMDQIKEFSQQGNYPVASNMLKRLIDDEKISPAQKKACQYNVANIIFSINDPTALQTQTGLTIENAFRYALEAADAGHVKAQYLVARAYHKGLGCEKNLAEANGRYIALKQLAADNKLDARTSEKVQKGHDEVTEALVSEETEAETEVEEDFPSLGSLSGFPQ